MKAKHLLLLTALMLMSLSAMATIVDGVRQKPTYTTSGFVENEEVYLYNVEAGKFWVNGNTYGTQASLGETGLLVRFVPTGSGDYYLQDYYNNGWWYAFFASETQMYVDRHSDANYYWQVENNGSTFRLSVSSRNPDYGLYSGSDFYFYVGLDVLSNTSNTALSPLLLEGTGHYIEWAFVTKSDFEVISEKIKVYEKAQELKSMIDKIEAFHADASSAKAVYLDESSTMAELQAAIDAALPVYVQAIIDNAPDKNNVDVTEMLVNPEYENGTNGWTVNSASGGNVAVAGLPTNKCFEAYNNSNFDIYQELSELPVGVYEIEVQGFYRYLRDDAAWQAYKAQNVEYVKPSGVPVYVYMNNNATPFKNIYSEPVTKGTLYTTDATLLYPAALNPCEDDLGNWYPNEMYNSAIAFNAGMYKQSAFGLVAKDGDKIRIGVKGASNQGNDSWVIWDNFKLIYRGFQADVIKPVLEAEMTTCQSTYMGLLMGKSQYAAMTQALADAQTAIDNNDGEAMFNALNALYDAKDPALSSKDLFLAQEVPAALQDLTDAINATSGQKLSNAVVEAANTLKANIEGNLVYEDADVEQLKQDVNNAISNISNSIAVYAQIPTAVTNLNTAATQKAAQTWIDDAATTASEATAAYNDGTYTDAEVVAKIDEINTLIESINNSADLYAQFNDAIGRLEAAIQLVTDDGQHVSKNMMAIANVQLTNAKNVYAEGSIADGDIPARITSIDDTIIPNLTRSIQLYNDFAVAIANLKATIDADEPASKTTRDAATTLLETATAAYNEGTVSDDDVEAQISALNSATTALQNSADFYAQLPAPISELEAAVGQKAAQSVLDDANTLLSDSKTGYADGTIEDADVEQTVTNLGVAVESINNSADLYAQFNDAIGRLEAAIQLVTDDGQHVSKNMMAIANVQLTNAKNVYAEGSIADGDIPARITSIDDTIIPNLTQSVVLYQQLSDAIASLKSAIEEDREVSAKTLNEATETYNSVSEAYENGTINDNEVEAQITAINNAIDNLNTSASIYSDFATSIATLEDAITAVSGRVSATMLSAANTLLSTAKTQHTEGTVNDDAVEARNSELGVACSNLWSSAPIYDVLASTRSEVEDLTVQVQDAYTALENLRTEIDDRYLTNEYRIDAGTYLDDQSGERNGYESDVNDLKTDIEPLGSALDATAATITDDHSGDYSSIESTITQLSINANGLKNNISNLVNNAEATVEDYIYASQFIIEMSGDYATFCSEADLDFTDVVGVKAFVAEFNETTMEVQLNRVLNVPAGTGIVLIGDAGTYTIPEGNNVATFTNELVGVSRRTVLAKTEGAYTNYIFANGSTGAGFYAVQDGTTLAAGKAYIPLRTTALSGAGVKSKGIGFVINDDTATDIDMAGAAHATTDDAYYTVTGTRVLTPTPGSIYIKNGKKVLVK